MVWDLLKNAHRFISDGYEKYTSVKKAFGGELSATDKRIADLLTQTGVQVDNIQQIHDSEGGWAGLARKVVGTEEFQHSLLSNIAEIATTVATDGVNPKSIMAMAQEGGRLFSRGFAQAASNYTRGDWVLLDNGIEQIPGTLRNELMWSEGEMFGEMPDSDEVDMETDHVVSLGFVTQVHGDKCSVFNLETGEAKAYPVNDMLHLAPNRVAVMEADKNIMALRAFVMEPDKVAQRLACDVPCDPGDEVVYKGKLWLIVSCDGIFARIQDGEEIRKVRMSEVERGRVTHNNSWNYSGETPTGFDRSVEPSLHKGMWVWLNAREHTKAHYPHALKELGVIRLLNGRIVDGYYALDGLRFKQHEKAVHAVVGERQHLLNNHFDLKKFRHAAMIGLHDVRALSAGKKHGKLVTGLLKFKPIYTHGSVEEGEIVPGHTQGYLDVGAVSGSGERRKDMAQAEYEYATGGATTDIAEEVKLNDTETDQPEETADGKAPAIEEGAMVAGPPEKQGTGIAMFVLGAVVIGAVYLGTS